MARTTLRTIICGVPAGTLTQDENGLISFTYDRDYDGPALSTNIPVSNRTYGQQVMNPYLFGLLPDSEDQRKAIAAEFDARPNNPVALLSHIGLDCPGGVQFCAEEGIDTVLHRTGEYRPIDDHEIALRLKSIRDDREASWMGLDESWSLGGNQGKFALALIDGRWCECVGSSPTTHIFKNGVIGFKLEALNEFVCMKSAQRAGIATANVEYRLFEDEPALIVERYDRVKVKDGTIMRLHQEDLCQALGVMPAQKYTADGGPTARDIQELLVNTSHHQLNLYLFTQILFFNAIIGAPDAHAKNYSLLLGNGGTAMMARMYDVASGLAYERMRRKSCGAHRSRRYPPIPRYGRPRTGGGAHRCRAIREVLLCDHDGPRLRGTHLHGRGHGRIRRLARHGGPARAYARPRPRKLPAHP